MVTNTLLSKPIRLCSCIFRCISVNIFITFCSNLYFLFLFHDTANSAIYTLSLHDALPICLPCWCCRSILSGPPPRRSLARSEEHTSELQSPCNLVCRLLLEKKKETTGNKKGQTSINTSVEAAGHVCVDVIQQRFIEH